MLWDNRAKCSTMGRATDKCFIKHVAALSIRPLAAAVLSPFVLSQQQNALFPLSPLRVISCLSRFNDRRMREGGSPECSPFLRKGSCGRVLLPRLRELRPVLQLLMRLVVVRMGSVRCRRSHKENKGILLRLQSWPNGAMRHRHLIDGNKVRT